MAAAAATIGADIDVPLANTYADSLARRRDVHAGREEVDGRGPQFESSTGWSG